MDALVFPAPSAQLYAPDLNDDPQVPAAYLAVAVLVALNQVLDGCDDAE
jgi:hypothetical protein